MKHLLHKVIDHRLLPVATCLCQHVVHTFVDYYMCVNADFQTHTSSHTSDCAQDSMRCRLSSAGLQTGALPADSSLRLLPPYDLVGEDRVCWDITQAVSDMCSDNCHCPGGCNRQEQDGVCVRCMTLAACRAIQDSKQGRRVSVSDYMHIRRLLVIHGLLAKHIMRTPHMNCSCNYILN